ncbi:predicted hydrolase involved in interstrand cross-link repair [Moesziomyces antarcticus T-34]|uniref:Predicted hydrolase involved in interstrand cross-link repair n=1 Tax=Pseudozyma antarctica (strain T-34) TaxID=1151754 RepID=M9M059_PSEA3|nr:predicted hydrolase involved in interstrand cross-link repair [Moesziomyces antarcticus T-34]
MAPSAAASPAKRRKLASASPTKNASPNGIAQPSLLSFFGNGAPVSASSQSPDSSLRASSDQNKFAHAGSSTDRPEAKTERTADCPICAKKVPFHTVQAHVNSCLDAADATAQEPEVLRDHVNEPLISASREAAVPPPSCSPARGTSTTADSTIQPPQPTKMTSISQLASTLDAKVAPTNDASPSPGPAARNGNLTDTSNTPSSLLGSVKRAASSAFTVLMKSHSESKQWATADAVEAANYRGKARTRPDARTAPFYKALEGMPLTVDAFRFGKIEGCRGYFLTHFHSDHYGGMTSNWNHGLIYCSVTTANLCRTHLGVDPQWLRPLPMEVAVPIPDSGGVQVTCIEANHCPGSCLFLFEGPQTAQLLSRSHASPHIGTRRIFRYLHCGDFRASPVHTSHPSIAGKKLDIIYLDTTYCNPRYCFPAQDQVIEACAELVRRLVPEEQLAVSIAEREKEREAGHTEDWTQAPSRKKNSVDQNSASATAFKGWFNTKVENSDGTLAPLPLDTTGVKQEDVDDAVKIKSEDAEDDALDYDEEDLFLGEDDAEDVGEEEPVNESPTPASELPQRSAVKLEPSEEALLDFASESKSRLGATAGAENPLVPAADPLDVKEEDVKDEPGDQDAATNATNWLSKHSEASRDASTFRRREAGRLLVVIGTYTIGKERIVKAVARAMHSKIFCMDSRKYRVYAQLEDPELHAMLTRDPGAAVHVTNLHAINGEGLRDVVAALRTRGHNFTHAVAFRPTGWTYRPPAGMDTVSPSLERLVQWNQSRSFGPQNLYPTRDSTPDYMIYGVPYSEHSSFFELTAFALGTRYDRIIATVNVGSPTSRAKMAKWFEKWMLEKRRRAKHGLGALDPRAVTYW